MASYYRRIRNKMRYLWRLYVTKDPITRDHRAWYREDGDSLLRQSYPLNSDSVVLDVGGYHGDWTEKIASKFDSRIEVFEAVPYFADIIREKFRDNCKVTVHSFGLAGSDGQDSFFLDESGSSRFRGMNSIRVAFRDVNAVLTEIGLQQIDLIKINIEGGEFPLLSRMLETGWIKRCCYLQIQFHEFFPDAHRQRALLRASLSETHELMWNYEFAWESWKRKDMP